MQFHIHPDVATLNTAFADWLTSHIKETLLKQSRYTISLAGGTTPIALYNLLASNYSQNIDWKKVHVFFDDERYVPFDDVRNNAKMAFEALLDKVDIPKEQVHIMRTDLQPSASAEAYESVLREYFDNKQTTFDMVVLGMGDDAHTLSLFPGTEVIHETEKWASDVRLDDVGNYRITLTAPVVNRAATVAFFVAGLGKAHALHNVLNGAYDPNKYPSQIINPASKDLHWFIDEAAASKLDKANL